jgi:opacity protein-like surface antigen
MKKSIVAMAAAVAVAGFAESTQAQSLIPLAVEARASAAVPTGDFSEGIGTGYGFGVNGSLKLNPLFGVYGGYSWTGYDYDDIDETLTQQGFEGGVRIGLGLLPFSPYARGGAVYHKLEAAGGESDRKLGYEVGAGLSFPLGLVISVTPEVSYTRINDIVGDTDLSAVRFGVGLRAGL